MMKICPNQWIQTIANFNAKGARVSLFGDDKQVELLKFENL